MRMPWGAAVRSRGRAAAAAAGRPLLAGSILAAAALTAGLVFLASCQTVRPDRVVVTGGGGEETATLDTLGSRLLGLRVSPDAAGLSTLRSDLDKAAAQPGLSRQLQARVLAMRAEADLLSADPASARRDLAAAASLSATEEGVWLARALLENDPAKRLAVLEEGIKRAEVTTRLLCERGELFLSAGRYAEAAQDLDEGLRGLAPGWALVYGADRDRAFALAQAARDAGSAPLPSEGLDAQLTIRSLVERTAADTRLLAGLSSDSAPSFASLLPSLKSAGLLLDPAVPPDSPATRKAVAWFLWGIVARVEHDPKLLTKYRQKYSVSPVPDVSAMDPWFDAVLGTVEGEIMDLPDGVHFKPDDPVTGYELVAMLARVKKLSP
jgi:hypothetical protein